jgi:hypothetical protein
MESKSATRLTTGEETIESVDINSLLIPRLSLKDPEENYRWVPSRIRFGVVAPASSNDSGISPTIVQLANK